MTNGINKRLTAVLQIRKLDEAMLRSAYEMGFNDGRKESEQRIAALVEELYSPKRDRRSSDSQEIEVRSLRKAVAQAERRVKDSEDLFQSIGGNRK